MQSLIHLCRVIDGLGTAITCTILATAHTTFSCSCNFVQGSSSMSKNQDINSLYFLSRDERCSRLNNYQILQKGASRAFDQLGTLLGIAPLKAEKIASRIICEDRMRGSIDEMQYKKMVK
ncbi:hypothetical protein L1987_02136 [Smallanthus sonchifolius]|uniref:Uncharacterized protein n=1 Tax=Smallanthus sonchifolius TaxID=185202 RepID=A0ACB9K708_9ASTR|nr:hypothetical protein L1987_02136 [Smallanthus sonchifolius]